MKRSVTVLSTIAIALGAFAQGTINFNNGAGLLISTNATGLGGTHGATSPALGGFYYGIFTAAPTITTIDASLQALLTSAWTFDGIYATNASIATGGRFNGGVNVTTLAGWPPSTTNSFLILGWSADVAGMDWNNDANGVAAQLAGAQLNNGAWSGANWIRGGFIGASVISFGAACGGTSGLPAFSVMSTAGPNGQGTPISTGFDLFPISLAPEPGIFALVGLAAAALWIFRRRKQRASSASLH